MEQEIINCLESFFKEMYIWEDTENKNIDLGIDTPDDILKQNLKKIYDKYVVKKNRKMGRLECMSIIDPPTFNPSTENIVQVEIDGKQATVLTNQQRGERIKQRKYKMKNIDDIWKIDSVKEYYEHDEKWYVIHL